MGSRSSNGRDLEKRWPKTLMCKLYKLTIEVNITSCCSIGFNQLLQYWVQPAAAAFSSSGASNSDVVNGAINDLLVILYQMAGFYPVDPVINLLKKDLFIDIIDRFPVNWCRCTLSSNYNNYWLPVSELVPMHLAFRWLYDRSVSVRQCARYHGAGNHPTNST